MNGKRVGVIMGGSAAERETSLSSGHAIAGALEQEGFSVTRLELSREGELWALLSVCELDLAFPALGGTFGADGSVQALLQVRGIPYAGSRVLSTALARDSLKAKEMFRLHNLPTPPYYAVSTRERDQLAVLHGSFGYPVLVRPRRGGSWQNAVRAEDWAELSRAVELGLRDDDAVLVERLVTGQHVVVAILDGRVLGATRVEGPHTVGLASTRSQGVLNLAERAGQALDCRGALEVHVLVTAGGNEYVLEVNTAPNLSDSGRFAQIARAAGFDLGALCRTLVSGALESEPSFAETSPSLQGNAASQRAESLAEEHRAQRSGERRGGEPTQPEQAAEPLPIAV